MLMFLYNIGMTIWKAKRFTTTEGVLVLGLGLAALLYLPALLEYENYTVAIFYRWWTMHLWVEGVWEMIQGGFLAYLLIRLSGADREVMEKWLYVIVGLMFICRHPGHGAPLLLGRRAGVLAAHRRLLQRAGAAALPRHGDLRVLGDAPLRAWPTRTRWRCTGHWAAPSSRSGAGLLGLAHTLPAVNKWTHGTLITAMHGHAAFFGAYVMIMLAMITLRPSGNDTGAAEQGSSIGYWAFWLQIGGMFGMTLAFAAAGIGQVYLERILGLGYLETQQKIQVHFLMLVVTGSLFAIGVGLFIYDFFRHAPRFEVDDGQKSRGCGRAWRTSSSRLHGRDHPRCRRTASRTTCRPGTSLRSSSSATSAAWR